MAQIDMIVDFAVERDEEAAVEGRLRLRAMGRIDDAQATRAHRGVIADRDKRIGNVAAMQHARDQTLDRRFSAIPIDGNRYAAHELPPKTQSKFNRSLGLTVGFKPPKGARWNHVALGRADNLLVRLQGPIWAGMNATIVPARGHSSTALIIRY